MNTDDINAIIASLYEVKAILTEDMPDMDVSEWNASPIGRAVNRIADLIERLDTAEDA